MTSLKERKNTTSRFLKIKRSDARVRERSSCSLIPRDGTVTANEKFFDDDKKAAAVLKHGVLRRYLAKFSGATSSTSSGKRVAYLDGYAGEGEYVNPRTGVTSEGSPAGALRIAGDQAAVGITLACTFIEKNPDAFASLESFVSAHCKQSPATNPFTGVFRTTRDAPSGAVAFSLPPGQPECRVGLGRRAQGACPGACAGDACACAALASGVAMRSHGSAGAAQKLGHQLAGLGACAGRDGREARSGPCRCVTASHASDALPSGWSSTSQARELLPDHARQGHQPSPR